MSGGRDHLTHRLRRHLPSVRAVALVLAGAQAVLCGLALGLTYLDADAVAAVLMACIGVGVLAIWALELPSLAPVWHPSLEDPATRAEEALHGATGHEQPILIPAAQESS